MGVDYYYFFAKFSEELCFFASLNLRLEWVKLNVYIC